MYKWLNFYVHYTRLNDCIDFLKEKHGIIGHATTAVEGMDDIEFHPVRAFFRSTEDLNTFLYQAYNRYGSYFYIDGIRDTFLVF